MLSDLFQRRFLYEFYNLKYFIRSCVLVFYVKIDQSHSKNTTDISLNVTDFFNHTIHYRIHEYDDCICKVINFLTNSFSVLFSNV